MVLEFIPILSNSYYACDNRVINSKFNDSQVILLDEVNRNDANVKMCWKTTSFQRQSFVRILIMPSNFLLSKFYIGKTQAKQSA